MLGAGTAKFAQPHALLHIQPLGIEAIALVQPQRLLVGEPIVCTPEDAFRCSMGTDLDVLAIGNCYLRKQDQDPALKRNYESAFELD
jgi:carbamoyltransferase